MDPLRLVFPPTFAAPIVYLVRRQEHVKMDPSTSFIRLLCMLIVPYVSLHLVYPKPLQLSKLLRSFLGENVGMLATAGGVLGYTAYDVTHFALHHATIARGFYKVLKKKHMDHHWKVRRKTEPFYLQYYPTTTQLPPCSYLTTYKGFPCFLFWPPPQDHLRSYGITSAFWDLVFGTLPIDRDGEESAAGSPAGKDSGSDGEAEVVKGGGKGAKVAVKRR